MDDRSSHLPAWLRTSGVALAAANRMTSSTVEKVATLQANISVLKASHKKFTETAWPAGTLWDPGSAPPPPKILPCLLDILPDDVLMGVLDAIGRAATLLALSQCCRRLRRLADLEPFLWRRLAAWEWGLPTHAISAKELEWASTLLTPEGIAPRPWSDATNEWKVVWLDLAR